MKPPENPVLLDRAALRRLGIKLHKVTLWRLEKRDKFPKRLKIGATSYWRADQIEEFILKSNSDR